MKECDSLHINDCLRVPFDNWTVLGEFKLNKLRAPLSQKWQPLGIVVVVFNYQIQLLYILLFSLALDTNTFL